MDKSFWILCPISFESPLTITHSFIKVCDVDFIAATFDACDLNNDGVTIDEIHKSDCLEMLQQQYGFENLTEIFLEVDANKDNTITKKEAEDAAITMMENFDRCVDGGGNIQCFYPG